MDYKKAGVDIEAGYKSVELMKEHVKRTMREEVLGGLGGFSGAFSLKKIKEMEDPVLLSGTDGCGTKVKLAMIAAFIPPSIATVATGTPGGICIIENTASIPSSLLPERGTPTTGIGNNAAHIPGRCAAMPAPAMITFTPLSSAPFAHSKNTSGSLCAEMIVIS